MIEVVPYSKEFRGKVFELIRQFYEESLDEYGLTLDIDSIERYEETHGDSTFVMLKDSEVIGVISGVIADQPMSDKKVYMERLWYVNRGHRKYGVKLIRYVEKWCAENGIGHVIMVFMHNSMPTKLFDFYKRMGYEPMETHLIKDVF